MIDIVDGDLILKTLLWFFGIIIIGMILSKILENREWHRRNREIYEQTKKHNL